MPKLSDILSRYRLVGIAIAISAAVHATVFVGMPARLDAIDERVDAIYSATLDASLPATAEPAPARIAPAPRRPASRPKPRHVASRLAPPPPAPLPEALDPVPEPRIQALAPEPVLTPPDAAQGQKDDVVAMAQPAVPVAPLQPPAFPVEALPPRVSIIYQL